MSRPPADRYGTDVLADDPHRPRRPAVTEVVAESGLVLECATSGFCGAVVGLERGATGTAVVLEDRVGKRRPFLLAGAGFLLAGRPVTLVPPARRPAATARTASGSTRVPDARARVARAGRIWVEGRHDAELVERVWGDDLRLVGVVVEPLHGLADLPDRVDAFGPAPGRRLGILVDHLVPGSKESRLAATVTERHGADVAIVGHPYVDVWQAIRPGRVGLAAWPDIPRDVPWKQGALRALGRPAATAGDVAQGWQWLLGRVRSYADLEPSLSGRVEQLIDFVTG